MTQQLPTEIVFVTHSFINTEAFEALRPHARTALSDYGDVAISLWQVLKEDGNIYFLRFRFETEDKAKGARSTGNCFNAAGSIAPDVRTVPSNYPLPDHWQNLVPEEE